MGFVYAAVLGPVGYIGVKLFSRHNELMQYQAGRGFRVWGLVVASTALPAAGKPVGLLISPATSSASKPAAPTSAAVPAPEPPGENTRHPPLIPAGKIIQIPCKGEHRIPC
jgi:hypothetical protein